MDMKILKMLLLVGWFAAAGARAADEGAADGQALYNKECSVCHGMITHKTARESAPQRSTRTPTRLAMASPANSVTDVPVFSEQRGDAADDRARYHAGRSDRLAVVPLYGPPLNGIVGRLAGTFSGYSYSKAFLQKMEGVTWDEARLDTWTKSSQTMVPGSFMFYSHKQAEVRAKIIQYLTAQTRE